MKKLFHVQLENGTYLEEGLRENIIFNFYIVAEDFGSAINIAMKNKNNRYYVVSARELATEGRSIMGPNLIL